MITKFKIFESNRKYEDENDLIELFSDKYIEKYFKDHFEIGISEIVEFTNFWAYVDKNKIADDIIKDIAQDTPIDDDIFTKKDYADYIKSNMLVKAKEDIDKYKEEYEEYDLDDEEVIDIIAKNDILNKDLINIISKYDENDNFKNEYFEDKYFNKNAEEILIDIHGEDKVETDLYDLLYHFIDENEVLDDYIDNNLDFDYKLEYFIEHIAYDPKLQKELLKIDPSTVLALYNVIPHGETSTLGNSYKFQKLYIEERFKETNDENTKAMAISEIEENFELNDQIKKEYRDYLYGTDSKKYNL